MKRLGSTALAILLATTLATPGIAQNVTAGVKAGVDFANLGGDFEQLIETNTKLKTGFSAGAFLGFDLSRLFRLQAELQYVQKGSKASEEDVEGTFKLDYMEVLVPLTLLIPIEGGAVQPRLYVGPSLAFEMSCKVKLEAGGMSQQFDCSDEEIGAPTLSPDYGVFFGGGIDIPAGSGAVTLDVLYNLGLRDIADEDPTDPVISVKNNNIQILVGYGFRLGG